MIFEVKRRENEDCYTECSWASGQTQQSGYFSVEKSQGLEWESQREQKFGSKHCGEFDRVHWRVIQNTLVCLTEVNQCTCVGDPISPTSMS